MTPLCQSQEVAVTQRVILNCCVSHATDLKVQHSLKSNSPPIILAGEFCFGKSAWKADALPLGDSRVRSVLYHRKTGVVLLKETLFPRRLLPYFSIKKLDYQSLSSCKRQPDCTNFNIDQHTHFLLRSYNSKLLVLHCIQHCQTLKHRSNANYLIGVPYSVP